MVHIYRCEPTPNVVWAQKIEKRVRAIGLVEVYPCTMNAGAVLFANNYILTREKLCL